MSPQGHDGTLLPLIPVAPKSRYVCTLCRLQFSDCMWTTSSARTLMSAKALEKPAPPPSYTRGDASLGEVTSPRSHRSDEEGGPFSRHLRGHCAASSQLEELGHLLSAPAMRHRVLPAQGPRLCSRSCDVSITSICWLSSLWPLLSTEMSSVFPS